jgi:xylulose-5-phosphate/fructose-6-phosphate phosphoketolase
LGYILAHAFGAFFDNPDLIVVAVVGHGEAETGPLEGSWKGVKFLNPVHDGAVLPVLHLNGYKICGPAVLCRDRDKDIQTLLDAHGYDVHFVEGDDPLSMHEEFAATIDACYTKIRTIQAGAIEMSFNDRDKITATYRVSATVSEDGNTIRPTKTPMPLTTSQEVYAEISGILPSPSVSEYTR